MDDGGLRTTHFASFVTVGTVYYERLYRARNVYVGLDPNEILIRGICKYQVCSAYNTQLLQTKIGLRIITD